MSLWKKVGGAALSGALTASLLATTALAAVAPPASVPTVSVPLSGAATSVPVSLTVSAAGDVATAGTLVLHTTGNFVFVDTTASITKAVGTTGAVLGAVTFTNATTITIAVTTGNTAAGTITVSGVKVAATATTVAGDTGNVTATGAVGGAQTVAHLVAAAGTSNVTAISVSPSTIPADGISTTQVTVSGVTLVAGDRVTVTTDLGTFIAASNAGIAFTATTATGTGDLFAGGASLTLRSPATPGTATIRVYVQRAGAQAANLDASKTIVFFASANLAVSEAKSTSLIVTSAAPCTSANVVTSIAATGGTADLCLVVNNGNGDPVAGATVKVSITPVGTVNGFQSAQDVTAADGTVRFNIAGAGLAGTSTIGISVVNGTTTTTFAPKTLKLTGPLATLTVKNERYAFAATEAADNALLVTGKDASGNDVPVTCTAGNLLPVTTSPTTVTGVTFGVVSDADGCHITVATTAASLGSFTVTVTDAATDTDSNAATLYVSGPAATIAAAFDKANVIPGGTASFTATLKDSAGRPAPDNTSVTVVASAGAAVNPTNGTTTANSSNGVATFVYLAPFNTGTATVTAFNAAAGSNSASINVGAPVPVTAGKAASALGVTKVGPFTTTTKLPARGKYVTVRFVLGATAAGTHVTILMATKSSAGVWSAYTAKTTRVADAAGNVYFYWRSSTAAWLSFRVAGTNAVQARWR